MRLLQISILISAICLTSFYSVNAQELTAKEIIQQADEKTEVSPWRR